MPDEKSCDHGSLWNKPSIIFLGFARIKLKVEKFPQFWRLSYIMP